MALNLDVKFETPEEHFLKHKAASYTLPQFNPKNLLKDCDICKSADANLTLKQQEVGKIRNNCYRIIEVLKNLSLHKNQHCN